jgi:hypothetical protein
MTLDNLLRIGQLKAHPIDVREIRELVGAARRNLADSRVESISVENRFDAAYKCIMQCALTSLLAHGYRPDTKKPGHHQTAIQTLSRTLAATPARIATLDALRSKRNLADYTGRAIDTSSLHACIAEAERLLDDVEAMLKQMPAGGTQA